MTQVRFWTGAWVIFFGLISYLHSKNKYYLLFIIAGPMIHFGHNISVLAILVGFILFNYPRIIFLIFILSFVFIFIPADFIIELLTINELGEHRTSRYVGNNTVGFFTYRQGTSFHARYYLASGQLFYTILLIYGIFKFDYFKKSKIYSNSIFASTALLLMTVANIGNISYAINMRFSIMAGLFSSAYLLMSYSNIIKSHSKEEISKHFKNLITVLSPLAVLVIFTQMSIIGNFLDFRVLISPFFLELLGEEPLSIKDFIRDITGL